MFLVSGRVWRHPASPGVSTTSPHRRPWSRGTHTPLPLVPPVRVGLLTGRAALRSTSTTSASKGTTPLGCYSVGDPCGAADLAPEGSQLSSAGPCSG